VPVRQGARLAGHNIHDPIVVIQNTRNAAGQRDRDLGYFVQGKLGSRLKEIGIMTYQKVARAQSVGMLRKITLRSSEPASRRNPVFEFTKADFDAIDKL
jgi:hypothetical protein